MAQTMAINATQRLNQLLSDILRTDSFDSKNEITRTSGELPSMTFAEHDYQPSRKLPSNGGVVAPILSRRNSSSLKNHRQRHSRHSSSMEKQSLAHTTPPLLNSSTLDDLFRALTLECEQYLAAATTITSYPNKTSTPMPIPTSLKIQTAADSNDDDYENLHHCSTAVSMLKTHIEVQSPEKKTMVKSRISSTSLVPSSRTFPLLSASSSTTTTVLPSHICRSSNDDDDDVSSSNVTRRRRRRYNRKAAPISTIVQSSSSNDEQIDSMMEKKSTVPKRSTSNVDHRQSRGRNSLMISSLTSSSSSQKSSNNKYPRRRDISLQHVQEQSPIVSNNFSRFSTNLCSPLSVLLTSTRNNSDFLDRSFPQRTVNHSTTPLIDRVHPQCYRPASIHRYMTNQFNNVQNNNNIPTHRIASYPVH